MTKSSGLGSSFLVGTTDLSGDTGNVTGIEVSAALLVVTGIDKSAPERILGIRSGKLAFKSFWNTSAGQAVPILNALPRADVLMSYLHGSTVGEAVASLPAKQVTYAPTRTDDGGLTAAVNGVSNGFPLEWGELLTDGAQTFASGTVNGTSVDGAAATSFGAAAYLHVLSLGSGTPTVRLQDSANNSAFSDISGMAFTAITGATTERIQGATNATVRRYVRVNVAGTYTNLVAVVNFVRYLESPAI